MLKRERRNQSPSMSIWAPARSTDSSASPTQRGQWVSDNVSTPQACRLAGTVADENDEEWIDTRMEPGGTAVVLK